MGNRNSRKPVKALLTIILAASMIVTTSYLRPQDSQEALPDYPIPARITYTIHAPILIDGDAGFLGDNLTTGISWGSGIESDPYIISGWEIDAALDDGIEIRNSDVHFTIRDCYIHHDGSFYVARCAYLYDCTNGTLENNTFSSMNCQCVLIEYSGSNTLNNNTCSNSFNGIWLESSDGNTLSNNTCSNIWMTCISLGSSNNNTLISNNCQDFGVGIHLYLSNNSTLRSNTCMNSLNEGIELISSNNNSLSRNNCTGNWIGISLAASNSNTIYINQLCDNSNYGLYIQSGSFSVVSNNTFIRNNGADSTYDPNHVQAFDDGSNNAWNDTDGHGNYWGDWTTPDDNLDGVVDVPYDIAGSAGARDYYPKAETVTIPEFSSGMVLLCMLAAAMIVVVGPRGWREKRP